MQGQNAALREEVMDLRLQLEGASAAADEVKQLRERIGKLQHDLEEANSTLTARKVCMMDLCKYQTYTVHDDPFRHCSQCYKCLFLQTL